MLWFVCQKTLLKIKMAHWMNNLKMMERNHEINEKTVHV